MTLEPRRLRGEGSARQRANGHYELRFWATDPDGNRVRKSVSAPTYEQAKALRDDILTRSDRDQPLADTELTVRQWFTEWETGPLADSERRTSTQDQYRSLIKIHALPRIGDQPLAQVRSRHVKAVLKQATNRAGEPLAASSRRSLYSALRAMFTDATTDRLLAHNPVLDVPRPKSGKHPNRALEPAHVQALLAESKEHRWHTVVALALYAALRRGEILGLRWTDVDLEGAELRVVGNLTRTSAGIELGDPKSESGIRTVPIPAPLVQVLKAASRDNARNRLQNPRYNRDGYVVTSRDGHPADPRTVSRWYARLAAKAKVPDHGLHALRHTAATGLLGSNAATELDVARLLGHSDTRLLVTLYADAVKESQRAAAEQAAAQYG